MNHPLRPLRQIADVSIGLTVRGDDASRRLVGESVAFLRISDLTLDGRLKIEGARMIDIDLETESQYLLKPGDIVMANRGTRMTSAVIPHGIRAAAGNQMFIIRVDPELSDPEFICWFLNLETTQERLRSKARGTYVQTLSIQVVRDLEVPVLPTNKIDAFKELTRLATEEREKMNQIAELRQKMLRAVLKNLT